MSTCIKSAKCSNCQCQNYKSEGDQPKSNIEVLLGLTNRFKALLESPSPGMFTWHEAVAKLSQKIGEFGH